MGWNMKENLIIIAKFTYNVAKEKNTNNYI